MPTKDHRLGAPEITAEMIAAATRAVQADLLDYGLDGEGFCERIATHALLAGWKLRIQRSDKLI